MKKITTTTTPNNQEPLTPESIYNTAKTAAYSTVRLLHSKSGNDMTRQLLNGFYNLKQSQDSADLVQVAALALWENLENPDAFRIACRAVRQYIYNQSNTRGNYKHIYIDDPETGDIIDVSKDLSKIIKKISDNEFIESLKTVLSPTQTKVLHYMAKGYTEITMARKLHITRSSINTHIERIRQKAEEIKFLLDN